MRKIIIALVLLVVSNITAVAQHAESSGLKWHTNLMEANQLSKTQHKPIFAFFTGSDWCGWCHKLQRDVFAKPAFVKWAKDKVILLELDFPRRKQLPQELMQQNGSLQQALKVQGYPTIWYFTMAEDTVSKQMIINTLGSQGYPAGAEAGKEEVKFLNEATTILAKFNGK
jgi:protein disulfide-isomerase